MKTRSGLADLARAADVLAEANIEPSAAAISGGRSHPARGFSTLFGRAIPQKRVRASSWKFYAAEARQRERLRARLAGRGSCGFQRRRHTDAG